MCPSEEPTYNSPRSLKDKQVTFSPISHRPNSSDVSTSNKTTWQSQPPLAIILFSGPTSTSATRSWCAKVCHKIFFVDGSTTWIDWSQLATTIKPPFFCLAALHASRLSIGHKWLVWISGKSSMIPFESVHNANEPSERPARIWSGFFVQQAKWNSVLGSQIWLLIVPTFASWHGWRLLSHGAFSSLFHLRFAFRTFCILSGKSGMNMRPLYIVWDIISEFLSRIWAYRDMTSYNFSQICCFSDSSSDSNRL